MVKTARMILDCKIGTKYYNTCTKCYLLTLITNKTWSKLVSNSLTLVPSLIYPAWFNTLIYTSPRTQILELNINSVFTSFDVHEDAFYQVWKIWKVYRETDFRRDRRMDNELLVKWVKNKADLSWKS